MLKAKIVSIITMNTLTSTKKKILTNLVLKKKHYFVFVFVFVGKLLHLNIFRNNNFLYLQFFNTIWMLVSSFFSLYFSSRQFKILGPSLPKRQEAIVLLEKKKILHILNIVTTNYVSIQSRQWVPLNSTSKVSDS